MSDDLHNIAEQFLREYLAQTGSKAEPVRLAAPTPNSAHQVAASKAAASDFIKELHKSRKEEARAQVRYEVEDVQKLVVARRTRSTAYFYGFKRGQPVFTHSLHLAAVVDPTEVSLKQAVLESLGIETFVLPAPSAERGSL